MKTIIKKPVVALLLLAISAVLLIIILRISNNWPFDTSWEEHKRINMLTERYGDELFEVVRESENIFTLSGYKDKDKDELELYLTGEQLYVYQEAWDRIHKGEDVVSGEIKVVSPQVVLYTGKVAEVVAEVHTAKKVRYGPNGPEIVDPSYEWVGRLKYTLKFEDGRWKVSWAGRCGFSDEECTR